MKLNAEKFFDPSWSNKGFSLMEEIRRKGKLCDITLIANNHKFTAHRIVLASSIPYFHAMFLHDMIESKQELITINSVESSALEQFINYSYNGIITITNENVQSLLVGANFLHLANIKSACCEFIKRRLSIADALCIRQFAEQFSCRDLIATVNRFINKHFGKISQSAEFLQLPTDELADILTRDELNVDSEEHVYETLINWVKFDEKNRSQHFHQLFAIVRLPLLDPHYLVDKVWHEPLVRLHSENRDIFDAAIHYHLLADRRHEMSSFGVRPRCCGDSFGLIYAIGGLNSNGGSVSTVEVYDCMQDRWRLAEAMITNRSRVAVAVLQGKLFAIGGYCAERLAIVEAFEPELKKWKRVSSISAPKSALGSAALNGRLYVCGGYNGVHSSDTVEMYNPKNDTWTMVSAMKKQRSAAGVAAFAGMIFVAGGHDGYRIFDSVECYDTQRDCWALLAPMSNKRCRLGLSPLNGLLYSAGGYDSLNFLNSVECYDPGEDKWTYVAPMNVKRSRMGLVTCNSRLYAIGGYDGVCNLSSVEFYEPDTNQWTMVAPMCAHEGVVGVGVLPIDVDLQANSEAESSKQPQQTHKLNKKETQMHIQNKQFLNYYSLIEDEEEEQYQSLRSQAHMQQRQLNQQTNNTTTNANQNNQSQT